MNWEYFFVTLTTLAGTMMAVSYIPQIIRIWRRKSSGDMSLLTLVLLWLGMGVWLSYGVYLRDFPLVSTNIISMLLLGFLILSVIWWRNKRHRKSIWQRLIDLVD